MLTWKCVARMLDVYGIYAPLTQTADHEHPKDLRDVNLACRVRKLLFLILIINWKEQGLRCVYISEEKVGMILGAVSRVQILRQGGYDVVVRQGNLEIIPGGNYH